jgi:hypothetical protein
MVGRLAAVAGPALWAGITYVAIEYFDLSPVLGQAAGIVVFLIMTAIGYFILRPVSDRPFHLREEYRDVS